MKSLLIPIAALVLAALVTADEKYITRYDNIDLDQILNNERLFNRFVLCLLEDGDGHCTADGKHLKKAVPDALSNDCSKCNEKQKAGTKKVLTYLINHKADVWQQLKAKYDSDGAYSKKYEAREKELHE